MQGQRRTSDVLFCCFSSRITAFGYCDDVTYLQQQIQNAYRHRKFHHNPRTSFMELSCRQTNIQMNRWKDGVHLFSIVAGTIERSYWLRFDMVLITRATRRRHSLLVQFGQ